VCIYYQSSNLSPTLLSKSIKKPIEETICRFTQAKRAVREQVLQPLWSGYGEIARYTLQGCEPLSVVIKHIALPETLAHPRGWHTDTGHQRKLRSYAVEAEWYKTYASQCTRDCRVPHCYGVQGEGVGSAMILQDLDAAGYTVRLQHADPAALHAVLKWLAHFHAQWLAEPAAKLWQRGSYWHLATRPDELASMTDSPLKTHAAVLDKALDNARFKTLIHGDAKIANFCFDSNHQQLAAVDFQYVGAGVGVVDVAYFLGSCLSADELQQQGDRLLEQYLQLLANALQNNAKLNTQTVQELVTEWRDLYPVAWADFERFLQGWSPKHPKLHSYSAEMTQRALAELTA